MKNSKKLLSEHSAEQKRYCYDGFYNYDYQRIYVTMFTQAVSKQQALNNIRYKLAGGVKAEMNKIVLSAYYLIEIPPTSPNSSAGADKEDKKLSDLVS